MNNPTEAIVRGGLHVLLIPMFTNGPSSVLMGHICPPASKYKPASIDLARGVVLVFKLNPS